MNHQKRKWNEHAVSPVVGVMLMLVVTIIIAAVVSAFAGGLATGKEKAPQATLETHITLTGGMEGGPSMTIKHMGGDPINTKDVKIVTSWANTSGVYHVQSTVAAKYTDSLEQYVLYPSGSYTGYAHYNISSLNVNEGGYDYYNEPYLVVAGQYPAYTGDAANETPLWFGNYVMRAGDLIKADTNLDSGTYGNLWTDKQIIKDANLLTGNDIVNVQLIDLKSGTPIYNQNIPVEV